MAIPKTSTSSAAVDSERMANAPFPDVCCTEGNPRASKIVNVLPGSGSHPPSIDVSVYVRRPAPGGVTRILHSRGCGVEAFSPGAQDPYWRGHRHDGAAAVRA